MSAAAETVAPELAAAAPVAKPEVITPPLPPMRYIGTREIHQILLDAFGVTAVDQICLRYTDHIPHAPIIVPLMRALGGEWGTLLRELEAFTAEMKEVKAGAGTGIALAKEAEKAVKKAQSAFTLIELMIVIAVIAVIGAIAIPALNAEAKSKKQPIPPPPAEAPTFTHPRTEAVPGQEIRVQPVGHVSAGTVTEAGWPAARAVVIVTDPITGKRWLGIDGFGLVAIDPIQAEKQPATPAKGD